jgi:hypothetical protein
MKTILKVALALSLIASGCTRVTPGQLKRAEAICEAEGGINHIEVSLFRKNIVECNHDVRKFIEQ